MSKIVFIKENSPEVRQKLENAGYRICVCAGFNDVIWLDYHPEGNFYRDIHGVGYTDPSEGLEELTPEERIKTWLSWEHYYSEDREFFETVEAFLEVYPKPKEK